MAEPITACVLASAPELATLATLEAVLSLARQALLAEHPTLRLDAYHDEPATLREARCVLRRITPFETALTRYRRAVFDALSLASSVRDSAADLPF
jgi:hypothetical protein